MNKTIFVTGHKNPDSDSICSALAYANLKQLLGESAIAVRLGALNDESKYILKRFNVEGPFLLKDARSQLRDIAMDEPTLIPMNMTMAKAWQKLYTVKNKSLFVVDEHSKLQGIISTSNLSSTRGMSDEQLNSLMSKASVKQIADTIQGKIIIEPDHYESDGSIYIVTLINGSHYSEEFKDSIVILSDGDEKQRQLIECGVKCLIITCKEQVSEENRLLALKKGCAIIQTDLDTMKVAKVITESIPVEYVMTRNVVTCLDTEYVNDVSQRLSHTRYRSYPVINQFGNIVGAISRYHLSNYERRRFILVDHSAKNQTINNIDEAIIEEIIDHHHIGDIQTTYPIYYRNMRCGCTSSIIAQIYQENGITPEKEFAGLMLGAIISDTMYFKSKTTTEFDKRMARWLADLAQVDLNEFALGVLSASISLKKSTPENILNRDLKTYEIGKYKIAIGQTNFEHMEDIQSILPSFKEYIEKEQSEKNYDLVIMMFSNIMAEGSMFVYSGPLKNIMKDLIETEIDEMSGYDSEIISRKQQLVPKLSNLLKMM
ncbi:putative manganese-dependent inorganic diphosphatase [uncultured Traorella sp.]|uniref:putative manganese-dependent inorganic diphosphatase n=1 Tax=uncultured Traorella sp. TaxID=1929048 RepID=UPI0025DCB0B7|nr:putative manganese-dependent inorganic diphosphatase [uncultured Traorella sp.]